VAASSGTAELVDIEINGAEAVGATSGHDGEVHFARTRFPLHGAEEDRVNAVPMGLERARSDDPLTEGDDNPAGKSR
jgi:hypothetical protein